jgi:dihydrofolate reductase
MKKIIAFEWLSLDGYIGGPNGETDWFVWDEEVGTYAKKVQSKTDTLLFGRTTYDIMANYWPTPASVSEDQAITDFMNETNKIVFSKTLEEVDPIVTGWKNTTVVNEITPEEIKKIKRQAKKNILIYGSGSIVSQLMKLGLIDEYQIMVNPVVLGKGKPLFQNIEEKLKLKVITTKKFKCGNVLITYQNEKE